MSEVMYSPLHNRVAEVTRVLQRALDENSKDMNVCELKLANYVFGRLKVILALDLPQSNQKKPACQQMEPIRDSDQVLNTRCEFFDLDSNRIQCAIGKDMYHCSRNCPFATNVPGSLPPYKTKYMKGRL